MSPGTTRKLLAIHRWCGIIVSLNFVVLALTGLILVFHDEIDDALGVLPPVAAQGEKISIARAVEVARAKEPAAHAVYVFQRPDESPGIVFVGLAATGRFRDSHPIAIDLNDGGRVLDQVVLQDSFTSIVLQIHAELFAKLPGRLFLGLVALAVVASLVTGAIVYGPTMRRFAFGLLRRDRSRRTLLADIHKLVGAATFGWNLVVASTGVLLALSTLLFQYWAATAIGALGARYAGEPTVTDWSTLDTAIASAEHAVPGRHWSLVALPGSDFASPRHYTVSLEGGKGLDAHLPAYVVTDAVQPDTVERVQPPWYIEAIALSEPLHFGNYGGLPLKIVWSGFTIVTLGLSITGVWVFVSGRRARRARGEDQKSAASDPARVAA
jgi:uncharacterized iron-regulated membrane protein